MHGSQDSHACLVSRCFPHTSRTYDMAFGARYHPQ